MTDIFDQLTAATNEEALESQDTQNKDEPKAEFNHTASAIKSCAQILLKTGLLEAGSQPHYYQTAKINKLALQVILEPFDLDLEIDETRGLAYLVIIKTFSEQQEKDEWTHPLVRRQRLTMEQSLLVAILRKHYLQHELDKGIGSEASFVNIEDLLPEIQIYLGELGSDALEQKRIRNLLDKLKAHGIVSEVDKNDQVKIKPVIVHLANPENLQNLLAQLSEHVKSSEGNS